MDDLERVRRDAERAEREYLDREEAAVYGYDVGELRETTREISKLLRQYRAGEFDPGSDTGEFIEASILWQAKLLEELRLGFPKWLADEQARIKACLTWVAAENAYAAALARDGGDQIERELAEHLDVVPAHADV